MADNRNVLMIVENLPVPFDRRVWLEAKSLKKAGFGVAVICPKKKIYRRSYERIDGIDIYRYPLIAEAGKGALGYFLEFGYCWLASLVLALKAYWHRPFHVIHACNPPDTFFVLALLFRPLGVLFVFDHHDLCPDMYLAKGHHSGSFLHRCLVLLERLTMRSAHLVLAVNQSHRDIAISRGGVAAGNVVVVRSGPPTLWADIRRPVANLKEGRNYLVVYLGEMCEQDGVDHLVRSIKHYSELYEQDTLFVLIGGGPDQPKIVEMADRIGLGEWVRFTGRVSDETLWHYLSTADVAVDPDPLTEWSNVSTMNKIIEYMAFGKPIVAFDLVEHRRSAQSAAVYVRPNDDRDFCVAIRELLTDTPRREKMATEALHRFRSLLAWEHSERELIRAYSECLSRSPGSSPLALRQQACIYDASVEHEENM